MKENNNFKYNIEDNFNHIFDEKGNMFLAVRKIRWGDSQDIKLDIRKWYSTSTGEEKVGKGFSFLTDEGPNELTKVLLETGYGRTDEVISSIKNRDDFNSSIMKVLSTDEKKYLQDTKIDTEEYYDPKESLF